jgi:hypothetical protein
MGFNIKAGASEREHISNSLYFELRHNVHLISANILSLPALNIKKANCLKSPFPSLIINILSEYFKLLRCKMKYFIKVKVSEGEYMPTFFTLSFPIRLMAPQPG